MISGAANVHSIDQLLFSSFLSPVRCSLKLQSRLDIQSERIRVVLHVGSKWAVIPYVVVFL